MRIQDIDERLEAAFDALSTLQAEQRALATRAAETKVAHETALARQMLRARDRGLAVEAAKATALDACEDSHLAMVLAESDLRVNRSTITTLTTQVDILRTMAATHRSVF